MVPNTPSNPLFPMTNPTQKVQKWSTFSCSRVAVLFLGQDFAIFFNDVNNMISTHTKDFCVKKLALICQISKNFLYRHISTTGSNA
jgi:hypothetical protein